MRLRFWEDCDSSQNLSLTPGTFSISVWVLWDALDFVVHKMTFAVLLWIFWFKQVHMFTTSHHFGSSWGKQNHLQSREIDPFKVKSSRFVMCPINSANKFRRTRVESYSLDSAVIFSFFEDTICSLPLKSKFWFSASFRPQNKIFRLLTPAPEIITSCWGGT